MSLIRGQYTLTDRGCVGLVIRSESMLKVIGLLNSSGIIVEALIFWVKRWALW